MIQLVRNEGELTLLIKLQKAGNEVYKCPTSMIVRCHQAQLQQGMLSFEICESRDQHQKVMEALRQNRPCPVVTTKVMLREMQPEGAVGLLRIL